jgi:hypothetical protein
MFAWCRHYSCMMLRTKTEKDEMRKEIKIFGVKLTPLKKPQLTLKTMSKGRFGSWGKLGIFVLDSLI